MTSEVALERVSRAVVLVTLAGAFMTFLDSTIVNLAVPSIIAGLPDVGLASASWVLNAYNVVFAAFLIPAGRIADVWGAKRCFMTGLAVLVTASALCAGAGSIWILVAGRALQAAGAAVLLPASLALLIREFPASRLAVAGAAFSGAGAFAAGVGPALGGALISLGGWRLIFLVNVAVGAAAIVSAQLLIRPDVRRTGTSLPDLAGSAALSVFLGALALLMIKGADWGWTSAACLAVLATALAGLAAVVVRSRRHPAPVIQRDLLRSRPFVLANAANLGLSVAFFGTILCNVLFLTEVWHYGSLRAGLSLTPAPVMAVIGSLLASRLGRQFGSGGVAAGGTVIFIAGIGLYLTLLGPTASFTTGWLPASALAGFGIGLAGPALLTAALAGIPAAQSGVASATSLAVRQMGACLGVALVVAVIGSPAAGAFFDPTRDGWRAAAAAATLAAGLSVAIGAPERRREAVPARPREARCLCRR